MDLKDLWANTSINDAERLPERVIRDYCGNSFHPDLISSALGDNQHLRDWVEGVVTGSDVEVADKNTFLQVYTHLCQEVEQLGTKQGVKFGNHLVKEFPHYPDPCDPHRRVPVPKIHDATFVGPRKPKQSNQAAVHHLGVPLSQALRSCGLDVCFDAFRAPITAVFQFEDYIRLLFGCHVDQLASSVGCQGPSLTTVSWIQTAFKRLAQHRARIALLDCLIAAGCSNSESKWLVGHFVVLREGSQHNIYYLGAVQPKLILLILEEQYGHPSMWMIGATAYNVPLQGGQSVPRVVDSATPRTCPASQTHTWLEHRDGQTWLHTPMHTCKQVGCTACLLAQIREFEYCPMHCPGQLHPGHLAHIVCAQEDASTELSVIGWLAPFSEHSKFWVFHVIRRNDLGRIVEHTSFTALPTEIPILCPCSTYIAPTDQNVLASQFSPLQQGWPFQDFRHFLIRTGGDQKHFECWLRSRSQSGDND